MEFKKERNFIVAYADGEVQAKWNILTGDFVGKSGKPVVACPRAFVYQNLPSYRPSNENCLFGYAIREYRQMYSFNDYTEARAQRLEQLLSVGLFPASMGDLDSETRLDKEIVQFFKENWRGIYSEGQAQNFLVKKKYGDFTENRPKWFQNAFFQGIKILPIDYVKTFLNRAERENLPSFWYDNADWQYTQRVIEIMEDYYKKCKDMYGEVKVNPNILSSYAKINALHKDFIEHHYDEILTRNNDKPFLYFQYEGYEARPLLTREAFHKEAEAQHNCVETLYMPRVRKGETYVVTVRRIEAPETSVITCEVGLKGNIVQYYGFANRLPTDEVQVAFRNAYANHLTNIFEK